MSHYIIAGKPNCRYLAHVTYVCMYLKKHLPNFKYTSIQLPSGEWEQWLVDKNISNSWHHVRSPIIWKELSGRGGKPYLIGGISEFWEYCYDYYGLQSILLKEDIEKLLKDNTEYLADHAKQDAENVLQKKCITVCGISDELSHLLLIELLKIGELTQQQFALRLFDDNIDLHVELDLVVFLRNNIGDMHNDVAIVDSLASAITDCDMLILAGNSCQTGDENREDWLMRNVCNMHVLADSLREHAKRSLKIVFAGHGPNCLNASVLIEQCTNIRLCNMIVVTGDVGLCPLKVISDETGIPLQKLNAPPVWGLAEIDPFIDIESVIEKCDIRRPYLRALRTNGGSTLPLGEITTELRYVNYLIHDKKDAIWDKVDAIKQGITKHLKRPPIYSKVNATIKALKIWFSGKPSNEIISLGIISNGSFGTPNGIMLSQPAIFDGQYWAPFKNFPITKYSQEKLDSLWRKIPKMVHIYTSLKQSNASTP